MMAVIRKVTDDSRFFPPGSQENENSADYAAFSLRRIFFTSSDIMVFLGPLFRNKNGAFWP